VLVQRYGLDIAADPAIMGKKYSLSYSLTLNRSGELVLFIFEGIKYSASLSKKRLCFYYFFESLELRNDNLVLQIGINKDFRDVGAFSKVGPRLV